MARGERSGKMDILNYLITIIFIFLLYLGMRNGVRNHKIGGTIIGLIFLIGGTIISGYDGILIILGGLIIIILSIITSNKEEEP